MWIFTKISKIGFFWDELFIVNSYFKGWIWSEMKSLSVSRWILHQISIVLLDHILSTFEKSTFETLPKILHWADLLAYGHSGKQNGGVNFVRRIQHTKHIQLLYCPHLGPPMIIQQSLHTHISCTVVYSHQPRVAWPVLFATLHLKMFLGEPPWGWGIIIWAGSGVSLRVGSRHVAAD